MYQSRPEKRQRIAYRQRCKAGFTLAELLISLAILGVIATFTIPKILSSQQADKKKAVFKETIATLYELTRKAATDNSQVATFALQRQFYRSNLNYTKECETNPGTQGCLAVGAPYADAGNISAFVLANGAVITSVNGGPVPYRETIGIDWNGPAGPNVSGDDILDLTACYGPHACDSTYNGYPPILAGPTGPGALGPNNAESVTLWTEIYD